MKLRQLLAILLPFAACAAQWLLWQDFIKPYVWFLFFPAAFFSSWLGGLSGGLVSTAISALLVWYVFMPPQLSFELQSSSAGASIALFIVMGSLFAWFFERLAQAQRKTAEALVTAEAARAEATRLYQKTLELDQLKSQFFANVSHELRTPLTLIMAPLEHQLRRPVGADFSAEARSEVEMMLRNARLLQRHVSDLLDTAKLEAGGMSVEYVRIDLAELVRLQSGNFDGLAGDRRIDYRVTTPTSLVIEADAEKLQRILINLLSNAFKFTPAGGCIVVHLAEAFGEAVIEVADNGPGVPAEMREAVFERFRQIDGASSRQHGGTGLGLAIVREFAQLHGGTARLDETPGGGACFTVRLPLKAPPDSIVRDDARAIDTAIGRQMADELAARALPIAPAPGDAGPDQPLVLVVEDNQDMNAFIVSNLRRHYGIATAHDGREGLQKALELLPDLILTDVMMPQMSGDDMVLELRRHPEMAGIPIVMLTAKADDALRVKLLEAGVQEYLAKPFAVDELLARIGNLVSERRRNQALLQESEIRFQATFEQAAAGIALLTPDGRWLRVNRRLCEMLGYSHAELLTLTFQDLTHPDDLAADLDQIGRMLSRQIESYAMEKRYLRKDGSLLWAILTVALVWKGDGTPEYFIKVVEDIGERKRAEAEIVKLNASLEQRVAERTAELLAANRELDSFAYAVSHDLRAPLRAMSGFSRALLDELGPRLDDEARNYLEQIDIASHKMSELIDGLLALSRSTRGALQRERVDLTQLARQRLEALARSEPQRRVEWTVQPGLVVDADARMFGAVMDNLLGNAWKYTGKTAAPAIRVFAEKQGGEQKFCVADNGAGFDMAHASHLFKPFQRLHRQDEFPGIGIGLATVQRIIHRHGGRIDAAGVPGQGATFCFTVATNDMETEE